MMTGLFPNCRNVYIQFFSSPIMRIIFSTKKSVLLCFFVSSFLYLFVGLFVFSMILFSNRQEHSLRRQILDMYGFLIVFLKVSDRRCGHFCVIHSWLGSLFCWFCVRLISRSKLLLFLFALTDLSMATYLLGILQPRSFGAPATHCTVLGTVFCQVSGHFLSRRVSVKFRY